MERLQSVASELEVIACAVIEQQGR
jgi:hypothetical protein